ncbi:MAG: hypothetical protein IJU75_06155 [Clostridia bacterium]|nr:hypothetical protein [Clostridia bacterium]
MKKVCLTLLVIMTASLLFGCMDRANPIRPTQGSDGLKAVFEEDAKGSPIADYFWVAENIEENVGKKLTCVIDGKKETGTYFETGRIMGDRRWFDVYLGDDYLFSVEKGSDRVFNWVSVGEPDPEGVPVYSEEQCKKISLEIFDSISGGSASSEYKMIVRRDDHLMSYSFCFRRTVSVFDTPEMIEVTVSSVTGEQLSMTAQNVGEYSEKSLLHYDLSLKNVTAGWRDAVEKSVSEKYPGLKSEIQNAILFKMDNGRVGVICEVDIIEEKPDENGGAATVSERYSLAVYEDLE